MGLLHVRVQVVLDLEEPRAHGAVDVLVADGLDTMNVKPMLVPDKRIAHCFATNITAGMLLVQS